MKSPLFLCIVFKLGCCTLFMDIASEEPGKTIECSPEILVDYFPSVFVKQTLNRFNIPEEKWDAIMQELNEKEAQVITIIEERASKIQPNPLKDPQQRQLILKITHEALFEILSNALKNQGIHDELKVKPMLDDIQNQVAVRFAECMQKQVENLPMEDK